jgi:hypothetical protein
VLLLLFALFAAFAVIAFAAVWIAVAGMLLLAWLALALCRVLIVAVFGWSREPDSGEGWQPTPRTRDPYGH